MKQTESRLPVRTEKGCIKTTEPELLFEPELLDGFSVQYLRTDLKNKDQSRSLDSVAPGLREKVEVPTEKGIKYLYNAGHSEGFINCLGLFIRNTDKNSKFPFYRTIMSHANPLWLMNPDSQLIKSTRDSYFSELLTYLKQLARETRSAPISALVIGKKGFLTSLPGIVVDPNRMDSAPPPYEKYYLDQVVECLQTVTSLARLKILALPGRNWYSSLYYRTDGVITITSNTHSIETMRNESQILPYQNLT